MLPMLLLCLSGLAWSEGLAPLRVAPELLRPADSARPLPASGSSAAASEAPVEARLVDPIPAVGGEPEPARPEELVPAAAPPQQQGDEPVSTPSPGTPTLETPLPQVRASQAPGPEVTRSGQPRTDVAPGRPPGATEVRALRIVGLRSVELVAEGEAELTRDDLTLTADRLVYNELTDEASARGNVRLDRNDDWITGSWARLIVHEWTGELEGPQYYFSREASARPGEPTRIVAGTGGADMLYFEGENQYRLESATWTTCEPESLDWYIQARDLELDFDRNVGVARGGSLVFKDVPVLWWPWIEFPLAEQRKSGFLVPTIGMSNKTGLDVSAPYYLNIAPNYDATVTPRYMGRRGLQLGGEFRYLGASHTGEARVEWLPRDTTSGKARTLGAFEHQHAITQRLHASVDLNWVSDDEYFEDLSSRISVASRVNLLREAQLFYTGDWWHALARVQGYQTLSGFGPYRRQPQLMLNARRDDLPAGMRFDFSSEYVDFRHRDSARAEGGRLHAYPRISRRFEWPSHYIEPRLGWHYTRYDLDRPLAGGKRSIVRSLPVLSIDGGLFFERETTLFGNGYLQTLEPRLFYVHVPYRDQRDIPRFDTARYDFGFAQIFTENRYSGIDRLGDANELTAAVTTRFIEPTTGIERLSATLGQQFYFSRQRVTLNETGLPEVESQESRRRTDVLAAVSGRVTRSTSIDAILRYNPFDRETQRFNFGVRYQPGHARVFNASYRYARDLLDGREGVEDVDFSAQWPLAERWYGVGRVTRSIRESRVTEAVVGIEYVSTCGCWVLRTAAHRFATNPNKVTNALFLQLELTGLGGIGSSPVNLLTRSVPGYGKINDSMPSRFFAVE